MKLLTFAYPDTMKMVTRALAAAALGALVFLSWEVFFRSAEGDLQRILARNKHAASAASGARLLSPGPSEISAYEAKVEGRSIFKSGRSEEGPIVVAQADALLNIALVGLLPGDNPQAILEDRKTQQTYYLSPKESSGGITVEEIRERSVTVSSGGQKKTFNL